MKKTLLLICSLFGVVILMGQSLDEVKQLLYHEKYSSAENRLHTILKNNASEAEAWYLLSEVYLKQNKISKIEDSLKLAPADVQNDPLFNIARGSVLLQKNSITNGWTYFNNALKATKEKNADVLLAVAKANIIADKGDIQKAIELLKKAIKKTKHKEEVYTALGDAWLKLHDASQAYQNYQSAIRENSQFAVPMYKLGMIFFAQKNPDMYLKFFNQAIMADPLFAPAYYRMYFHYYFRNVNAAMEYLQKYMATADHSLKMDYDKTDLLYLTKKYNDAILEAKRLIQEEKEKVQPRIYKLIAYSYK
ncbi:MAG: tetratricopeptide repeat protein, partial [Bacteroidia bacterium]|nr:tetratricopeptide repeat protein [Bacteroidia bacterium]